jgi:glycosyltransferase involved in cell wall biosynthesis
MAPKVSICLPNLNNMRFLPERLESIFQQSFTDWELVVVDNYSDDGAWRYFVEEAAKERRMRISQAPREGIYGNWNNCLATGKVTKKNSFSSCFGVCARLLTIL